MVLCRRSTTVSLAMFRQELPVGRALGLHPSRDAEVRARCAEPPPSSHSEKASRVGGPSSSLREWPLLLPMVLGPPPG